LARVGNVLTFGVFFRDKAATTAFHQLSEYSPPSGRQV
jgi:hypothetical protein